MTLNEIAASIKNDVRPKRPILIAIEGFGGSGKTTLANKLKDILGSAYVVNIDDFIVKEKLNEPSWDNGAFDRERLERQVLIPASINGPIAYEELIWETNSFSKPKHVPDVDFLIVEGISAYHPNIALDYDYKIWIDTPNEDAKARGQARDAENENVDKWDLWAQNDLAYQQRYHPEQHADFKINNA